MDLHPCASSEISHFGYDPKTRTLALKFHRGSGGAYSYLEVPEDHFKAFLKSHSKGAFFHRFIEGKFEVVKPESINVDVG